MAARDWRADLSQEDVATLDELLGKIAKHRRVYKAASEPALAQLWLALLEVQKQQKKLNQLLGRLEKIASAFEKDEKGAGKSSVLKDLEEY